MKIKTQGNTGLYVTLVPDLLNFTGAQELSMYFVKEFKMTEEQYERLSGITGMVNDFLHIVSFIAV